MLCGSEISAGAGAAPAASFALAVGPARACRLRLVEPAASPRRCADRRRGGDRHRGAGNSERKRLIDAFGGQYNAPAPNVISTTCLRGSRRASDAPTETYHVTLLDSPIVNAFALPTGDIFVTRGLLGARQRRRRNRRGDGARDRPRHGASRRPARRARAHRRAVHARLEPGARQAADWARSRRRG